jgi:tetratricopeptide (TPR) repeat protein
MLAALHARAGALVLLGDHAAALADLDSVVVHRGATLAADDPLLLEARRLRAISLMVAGRPADAVDDLDEILRRELTGSAEATELLELRHQRALCLAEAGRVADALTEIDRAVATAADVETDPSVTALVGVARCARQGVISRVGSSS